MKINDKDCNAKQLAAVWFVREHGHHAYGLANGKIRVGIAATFYANGWTSQTTELMTIAPAYGEVRLALGY